MMTKSFRGQVAALASGLVIVAPAASAEDGVKFTPYRASYLVSLGQQVESGDVKSIDGLLEIEITDACDSWHLKLESKTLFKFANGQTESFHELQTTKEAKDGSEYHYSTTQQVGTAPIVEARGKATLDSLTRSGKVVAELPTRVSVDLPKGTMFPITLIVRLLKAAKEGSHSIQSKYFSVSDPMGVEDVVAKISDGVPDWSGLKHHFPALQGLMSYAITLDYHSNHGADDFLDTRHLDIMYENGVLAEIEADSSDLSAKATLDQLEMLPANGCSNPTSSASNSAP